MIYLLELGMYSRFIVKGKQEKWCVLCKTDNRVCRRREGGVEAAGFFGVHGKSWNDGDGNPDGISIFVAERWIVRSVSWI